ncbi:hypothetical protein [Paenibacillus sp. HB172176]|uniref:hypothetical protein n=1 Tax=Paenibacillus sp. HB172176 TaxID=2493690 RepID=UPI00143BFEFE|nr:hypothetical protein [Paenibacillus sp. HB172176]
MLPASTEDTPLSSPIIPTKGILDMGTSHDYAPYENVDANNGGEIVGMISTWPRP